MKYSFARALATASFICVTVSSPVFAQAATMPVQDQVTPDLGENLNKTWPKADNGPSPYQIQEQAIQKALAEDAAQAKKQANNFPTENLNSNYNDTPKYKSASKMRGMASMAGHMLAKTAQVTLPTAGMVLMGAAMNRAAYGQFNNGGYRGGYNQSPMARGMMQGSYPYGSYPMQNGMNYGGMPAGNYGYAPAYNNYYTGH